MQELLLTISGLTDDGRGVARHDGKVYFVAGALPEQQVAARVTREKKRFAEAETLRVLADMPDARPPLCPHAADCGGCPLQTMPYERQLAWKARLVRDAFGRIGGLAEAPVLGALPSPRLVAFRNKMEFAFGEGADGALTLGLRRRGSRAVLPVTDCALMPEGGMRLLAALRDAAAASGLAAQRFAEDGRGRGTVRAAGGLWRFAVLRHAQDTGGGKGWWLQLVTGAADAAARRAVRQVGESLLARFPALKGVVHDVRLSDDMLAQGEKRALELGSCGADLVQELDGQPLRLDIGSFYQVNTEAAGLLCREAKNAAALRRASAPVLWDVYCGSGAPGLALAGDCALLLGVEYDAAAVRRAGENARALGHIHCRYEAGDAEAVLTRLAQAGRLPAPDVVLVDPPRAGMAAGVLRQVVQAAPARVVYISCNPATLARDAGLLCAEGYALRQVRPVDLFPHTPHVECVALLERR